MRARLGSCAAERQRKEGACHHRAEETGVEGIRGPRVVRHLRGDAQRAQLGVVRLLWLQVKAAAVAPGTCCARCCQGQRVVGVRARALMSLTPPEASCTAILPGRREAEDSEGRPQRRDSGAARHRILRARASGATSSLKAKRLCAEPTKEQLPIPLCTAPQRAALARFHPVATNQSVRVRRRRRPLTRRHTQVARKRLCDYAAPRTEAGDKLNVGLELREDLRGHHGGVDGRGGELAPQGADDGLGNLDGDSLLGLVGGGAEVRGADDVRTADEGIFLGGGLNLENVEGGALFVGQ